MESSPQLIKFLNKARIPYRKINESIIDINVPITDDSSERIIVTTDNLNNY